MITLTKKKENSKKKNKIKLLGVSIFSLGVTKTHDFRRESRFLFSDKCHKSFC
jgi:hypothetical protein